MSDHFERLNPTEIQLLNRALRCDIEGQTRLTHVLVAIFASLTLLLAAAAMYTGRAIYLYAALAELFIGILICFGRYQFLKCFQLIQALMATGGPAVPTIPSRD